MLGESCATCTAYLPAKRQPERTPQHLLLKGKCRRYPQHVDHDPDDWCREHRRKQETA